MKVIYVGSTSKIKVCAVKKFFETMYTDVDVRINDVESMVSEQPVGEQEIQVGAMNRTKFNGDSNAIFVGIENGIIGKDNKIFDVAYVNLYVEGIREQAMSDFVLEVPSDFELKDKHTTWPKYLISKDSKWAETIKDTSDPHKYLSDFCREDQIIDGLSKCYRKVKYIQDQIKKTVVDNSYSFRGIDTFCDINSLCMDRHIFRTITMAMVEYILSLNEKVDYIAAIDSRGYIFGSVVSDIMNIPLTLVRKKSKSPPDAVVYSQPYSKEYSEESDDVITVSNKIAGSNIVVIDDILATGGTYQAVVDTFKINNNIVLSGAFAVSYTGLYTKENLPKVYSVVSFN